MSPIVTTIKERVYLGPLRPVFRRAGLGGLRSLSIAAYSLLCRVRYHLKKPKNAVVRIGELAAKFPISSSTEMCQIETLNGERKLVQKLIREIWTGDVVYDIGTNIGLYTVFLAKAAGQSGRVFGFEPELRCYDRCQENLRFNLVENARLFDVALGRVETTGDLVVCGAAGSGTHHVLQNQENTLQTTLQRIRVAAGDGFIAEERLPWPNVVKIDVEGMELDVLAGLSRALHRPECRLVCCEVHFSILEKRGLPDVPKRILEFLSQAGFTRIEWVDWSHCYAHKA